MTTTDILTTTAPSVAATGLLARPDGSRARALRTSMNDTLLHGLRGACDSISGVYPMLADLARVELDTLDTARRLSPELYTAYWQLTSGIKSRNAARVAVGINQVLNLHRAGRLYADGFTLTTLQWDGVDNEITNFLASAEGPRTRDGLIPEIAQLDERELGEAISWINGALPILHRVDPDLYSEFQAIICGLRTFKGRGARGITSPRCFGLILLRTPTLDFENDDPVLYFLDHITHETSHLVLHGIMNRDRLIENGFTGRFKAPMRTDPRPLYGIYHAVFVLARIVRVVARYAQENPAPPVIANRDLSISRFHEGYETLQRHAELTDAGRALLESCRDLVAEEVD